MLYDLQAATEMQILTVSSVDPNLKVYWSTLGCFSLSTIYALIAVRYVQEEIFLMVFLVKLAHCRTRGRDHIIDKEEQCILGSQVNSLTNEEVKLSNCEGKTKTYRNLIKWSKC